MSRGPQNRGAAKVLHNLWGDGPATRVLPFIVLRNSLSSAAIEVPLPSGLFAQTICRWGIRLQSDECVTGRHCRRYRSQTGGRQAEMGGLPFV